MTPYHPLSFSHGLANTLASDHHRNSHLLCRAMIFVIYNNPIGIPFRLLRASFFLHHHVSRKLHGCTIFAPLQAHRNPCTHPRLVFSDSSCSPLQHRSHNLWHPRNTATTCHFRRATTSSSVATPMTDFQGFLYAQPSTSKHYCRKTTMETPLATCNHHRNVAAALARESLTIFLQQPRTQPSGFAAATTTTTITFAHHSQ
ncbi:hypothetical protein DEO72_LG5g2302 [Vigna unguiculata]|uniref:Uncharacterized protein n=1 Tax=Vigna unguiculata TaxID=3917 RepID=A0A4D6M106_VIGUN|nr:hypothetical protein DEO72_LG5g2302 [Vigna unguiculata]